LTAYLVRHAKAGDREEWSKPDHLRPLTKSGHRQAEGLIRHLGDVPIDRIITSPYVRCVQTVEPLARALGLRIERSGGLAEGAAVSEALELIRESASVPTVLCSHGDVILEVLDHLADEGLVGEEESRLKKGSVWVIETSNGGAVARARYLPPPA
jgi:phosphohistidine phosphatase SixA